MRALSRFRGCVLRAHVGGGLGLRVWGVGFLFLVGLHTKGCREMVLQDGLETSSDEAKESNCIIT